jgi:hypothetical protein
VTEEWAQYGTAQQLTLESFDAALKRGVVEAMRTRDDVTGADLGEGVEPVEVLVPYPEPGDYYLAREAMAAIKRDGRPVAFAVSPASPMKVLEITSSSGSGYRVATVAYTVWVSCAFHGPDHPDDASWPGRERGEVDGVQRTETAQEFVGRIARTIYQGAIAEAILKWAGGTPGTIEIDLADGSAADDITHSGTLYGQVVVPFTVSQKILIPQLRGAL